MHGCGGARGASVIPEALQSTEVTDHDADELIVTVDMRARKGEMDRRSDGFLILPGGLGTLEELFEIWTARHLGLHTKPVVVLDQDGLFAPLRAQLEVLRGQGFLTQASLDEVTWATSVAEAVAAFE
jgi:uncharacterized protein (TIGR00730 family)